MFGAYEVMMTRTFIHSPSAGRSVPPRSQLQASMNTCVRLGALPTELQSSEPRPLRSVRRNVAFAAAERNEVD